MRISERRWTWGEAVNEVPEFVMLGHDDLLRAMPLVDHAHPGCYEFVFIERGKASWEVGDERFDTQAGDVFHSRPDEIHRGGFHVIEPCKFWWLIVREPNLSDWLRLTEEENRNIAETMSALPRVQHAGFQPLEAFRGLRNALESGTKLRSMAVRQAIQQLLFHIIVPVSGNIAIADDLLGQFDRLIRRMEAEPEWRPTVEQLAESVGISVSHFHRTFRAYTGFPPTAYIERQRHKEACRLLSETKDPITDIAFSLGYPSSQHFATVFKRFYGLTPTQWRSRS